MADLSIMPPGLAEMGCSPLLRLTLSHQDRLLWLLNRSQEFYLSPPVHCLLLRAAVSPMLDTYIWEMRCEFGWRFLHGKVRATGN